MRFNLSAFAAAAFAVTSLAASIPSDHVLHEKRAAPLKKWAKRSRVPPHQTLPMRIGLTQSNIHNGEGERLMDEV